MFEQIRKTRELITSLQNHQASTKSVAQTIHDQLVLEIKKVEKVENQEHQWIIQAKLSLINLNKIIPHMRRLLIAVEEKTQILGTDMINILSIDIHQKVDNLTTLTTLTTYIHIELRTWEEFQHQLSITT